jgi:uncharacterized membrane-anchored protein YhcB (DUF1043 family)
LFVYTLTITVCVDAACYNLHPCSLSNLTNQNGNLLVMTDANLILLVSLFLGGIIAGVLLTLLYNKIRSGNASPAAVKKEMKEYQEQVEAHFDETSDKFRAMAEQYKDLYEHLSVGATTLCRPDHVAPGLKHDGNPLQSLPKSADQQNQEKKPSAEREKAPLAQSDQKPSANESKEPSAKADKEPSAKEGKGPSAKANREPSAKVDKGQANDGAAKGSKQKVDAGKSGRPDRNQGQKTSEANKAKNQKGD